MHLYLHMGIGMCEHAEQQSHPHTQPHPSATTTRTIQPYLQVGFGSPHVEYALHEEVTAAGHPLVLQPLKVRSHISAGVKQLGGA
jgi:hypothetical protein